VQSGSTFSDALALHPRVFNDLYVNMVKAGEVGRRALSSCSPGSRNFRRRRQDQKQNHIGNGLSDNRDDNGRRHPVFSPRLIVPKFESIFHEMLGDKPLPPVTQFVIAASDLVQHHGLVVLGVVAAAVTLYKFIGRTRRGRLLIDNFKLRMPLFWQFKPKNRDLPFRAHPRDTSHKRCAILQALNITRETAG